MFGLCFQVAFLYINSASYVYFSVLPNGETGWVNSVVGSNALCILLYGLLTVANNMQDPFGFDAVWQRVSCGHAAHRVGPVVRVTPLACRSHFICRSSPTHRRPLTTALPSPFPPFPDPIPGRLAARNVRNACARRDGGDELVHRRPHERPQVWRLDARRGDGRSLGRLGS